MVLQRIEVFIDVTKTLEVRLYTTMIKCGYASLCFLFSVVWTALIKVFIDIQSIYQGHILCHFFPRHYVDFISSRHLSFLRVGDNCCCFHGLVRKGKHTAAELYSRWKHELNWTGDQGGPIPITRVLTSIVSTLLACIGFCHAARIIGIFFDMLLILRKCYNHDLLYLLYRKSHQSLQHQRKTMFFYLFLLLSLSLRVWLIVGP
ncbi:hypothetical protein ACJX0J_035855, partial [Zea mays]